MVYIKDYYLHLANTDLDKKIITNLIDSKVVLKENSAFTLNVSNDPKNAIEVKLKVLLTSPTSQGVLDSSTRVILTSNSEESDPSDYSTPVQPQSPSLNPLLNLHPLQLISDPSFFKNSDFNPKDSSALPSDMRPLQSLQLPFKIASKPFTTVHQLENENLRGHIDIHSSLAVPIDVMMQLQLMNGDWIVLTTADSKSRWTQIFGLDQKVFNEMCQKLSGERFDLHKPLVLIDAILGFNLGLGNSSELVTLQRVTSYPFTSPFPLQPIVAQSVSLAWINSSYLEIKSIQKAAVQALKNYFQNGLKVVKQDDIIPLPVSVNCAELQPVIVQDKSTEASEILIDLNEDPNFSPPSIKSIILYFKVLSNTPTSELGALIDPNDCTATTLQPTNQNNLIPSRLNTYFDLPKIHLADNTNLTKLRELIDSCLDPMSHELDINCSILISGPRGSGKYPLIKSCADEAGLQLIDINCFALIDENDSKTEEAVVNFFNTVVNNAPCVAVLSHIEAFGKKFQSSDVMMEPWLITMLIQNIKDLFEKKMDKLLPVTLIATCETTEGMAPGLVGVFRHELNLGAPDESMRLSYLTQLMKDSNLASDVDSESLAIETAALMNKDLKDLVDRAGGLAYQRILKDLPKSNLPHFSEGLECGANLLASDFNKALDQSRSQFSDSIGAPKIPNVTWDDVGGLASVKEDILDTIQLPLRHPELFASGAKQRSGVLLYGPPGTGKTLLAKAVATSCSLNFFSVKGPELLNMYIGESEANVRRVFQRARDAKPCVIFFDELDSVAPKRGEQGDSGGVMDRIVSQLLAELDGMSDSPDGSGAEVFVIGATNRPDLLDPALLRPGRFDKLLYLGVADSNDAQLNILSALTRKFTLDPNLDLNMIVDKCPFHFTGADFYALCSDSMLKAMTRTCLEAEDNCKEYNKKLDRPVTVQYYLEKVATPAETRVEVRLVDFEAALDELQPSVTPDELARYQEIRAKFS
jgi:peroxin-6